MAGGFDLWRNGVLPFAHRLDPLAPPRLRLKLWRRLLVFALSSLLIQRGQHQILILRLNLDSRSKTDGCRPLKESVNTLDRVYGLRRKRDARVCCRSRPGRTLPRGVLLLSCRSALAGTIHYFPFFTLEMRQDPIPIFSLTLIAVFRRPARSLPKCCMETLFGVPMRGVALFMMIINKGLVGPISKH